MSTTSPSWTPDASVFNGIVGLLKQADSTDSNVQRRLAESINQLEHLDEAPCYFCYLLVDRTQSDVAVRQRAGLLLKARISALVARLAPGRMTLDGRVDRANLASVSSTELAVLEYVKVNVLQAICDPLKVVRETAGTILATIVGCQGVETFPQLLPTLFALLGHQDAELVTGAFGALSKIIEDELERNDSANYGTAFKPGSSSFGQFCRQQLLPKLLQLATTDTPLAQRRYALICLNHFERVNLFNENDAFSEFFDQYWNTLGMLAMDTSCEIRLPVLQGFVHLVQLTPELIFDKLTSLIPFLLDCLTASQTYEVKLEALDVLLTIVKQETSRALVEGCLPRLLPLLVENAKYSEWDYLQMDQGQQDDNASSPDEAYDIAPRFHKQSEEDDEEEEDDEDDAPNKGVWGASWTVRKSSAMLLDHLSVLFHDGLLPSLLPVIESGLQNADWEVREASVLTLGAIAQGCISGLEPFLPKVLAMLLNMCDDKKPILRSICLWTVSRFSMWITDDAEFLKVVAAKLLLHVLDRNKRVQEAACSAFAGLEEEARILLLPYLNDIINTFSTALQTYQAKNLRVLFDVIGTLSEALGTEVDCALFHQKLVEPLLHLWVNVDCAHPILVASFECLTCVVAAIPSAFPRYAPTIVNRCLHLIRDCLGQLGSRNENTRYNREVVECSLDLLSACCEVLHSDVAPLLSGNDALDLLEKCCKVNSAIAGSTIKQAAFALVGDLAENAPHLITTKIPAIVPELTSLIASGPVAVCNNASWALGQIALHASPNHELDPFVPDICMQLIRVIHAPYSQPSLIRNACLTLGRLGRTSPAHVGAAIPDVFAVWCKVMEGTPNESEKVNAFNGICHVIHTNQALVVEQMPLFLDALCSLYFTPMAGSAPPPPPPAVSSDVHQLFVQLVTWFQSTHQERWTTTLAQIKPESSRILESWFA